ncbi:hypothetical protein [Streptacidiphilus cavernicola]|uniref:Uncharacterized protein n=1 Tax=Streptacidiphilus cavernicola TaxID=3342716 RepID=A0ABV6VYC0_9ACTN
MVEATWDGLPRLNRATALWCIAAELPVYGLPVEDRPGPGELYQALCEVEARQDSPLPEPVEDLLSGACDRLEAVVRLRGAAQVVQLWHLRSAVHYLAAARSLLPAPAGPTAPPPAQVYPAP